MSDENPDTPEETPNSFLGDIVLFTQEDGAQVPAIIVRLDSQNSAVLDIFGIGGVGGSSDPVQRGNQPGEWQPRPRRGSK